MVGAVVGAVAGWWATEPNRNSAILAIHIPLNTAYVSVSTEPPITTCEPTLSANDTYSSRLSVSRFRGCSSFSKTIASLQPLNKGAGDVGDDVAKADCRQGGFVQVLPNHRRRDQTD